jgi:hypothetical protein
MSCCKPNLQQVTKLPQTFNDGAISINMRALIQPRPGWELVSADYSQIEVRVMAHFCGDRGLLQLFAERKDVYRLMGGMVFNTRPESVTEQQRNFAKVLALAAIYGQGVEQMAAKMKNWIRLLLLSWQIWVLVEVVAVMRKKRKVKVKAIVMEKKEEEMQVQHFKLKKLAQQHHHPI